MKAVKYFSLLFLSLFAFSIKVYAADLSISASSYNVYVGSNVNITVNGNGLTGKVSIKSNNLSVLSGGADKWVENSKTDVNFKALKTGTATITVSPVSLAYSDGSGYYTTSKSVTINVINKPASKPSNNGSNYKPSTVTPKSSVNYLKSLEIEGQKLNPNFDKETAEYSVQLESGVTSINIKATAQDNKARITGAGKKTVSEGMNTFDIVVTAENGSKRTYKIKVNVKEKDPIVVKINNENYTVIRKREQLKEASTFYSESTVKINDEDIPAYFGEVTGYTLVGLKDSKGEIDLYIYDEENSDFKLYREFKFLSVTFYPLEVDKKLIPKNYFEDTILVSDIELPCYKINKNDEFVLLYGVNIENNNEGFYVYDPVENTLQRYNEKIFDKVNEENMALKSIVIGLLGIIFIVVIVAAIEGQSNENNRKKQKNNDNKETKIDKKEEKNRKKEAKLLSKELKRKEKIDKKKRKAKLDDTDIIDINDINIKK